MARGGASLGSLVVSLGLDAAEYFGGISKANQEARTLARSIDASSAQMRNAFKSVGTYAVAALGGFTAAKVVSSALEAEQASNRLTAVLTATGHSAGIAKRELDEMAEAMMESTQFDDESIRAGQATLLKFGNIQEDVFRRAMKTIADYAAFSGTDIATAAQTLGKALQSPAEATRGLEKDLGKLNFAQKENIKTLTEQGKLLEAQVAILGLVDSKIAGTADLMNTGLTKSTKDVSKAWNEMLETIGTTDRGEKSLSGLANFLKDIKKTIEGTKNPLRDLVLEFAAFVDKIPSMGIIPTQAIAATLRGAILPGPSRTRPISRPGEEEYKLAQAAQKKREDDEEEQRYKGILEREKNQVAVRKALAEGTLAIAKNEATQRLKILDMANSAGLYSIKGYYDARAEIVKIALDAELKAIGVKEAETKKVLSTATARSDYAAEGAAQLELTKLADQRRLLQKRAADEYHVLSIQQVQDTKKFKDEIEDLNIELLELQGNIFKASERRASKQFADLRTRAVSENRPDLLSLFDDLEKAQVGAVRKQYEDEIENLSIRLLEIQGKTVEAASRRFDMENFDLSRKVNKVGTPEDRNILSNYRSATIAQAEFNAVREDAAIVTARLALEEERIQNSLRVGAISEIGALKKTGDARRAAVEQMEAYVENLERMSAASPLDKNIVLQAEQARAALEKLRGESDLLAEKFNTIFTDSFSDAFTDFVTGTKTAAEAFKSFSDSVVQQITRMASNDIATQLGGALGITGQGNKGGGGGFNIGSILSNLWGGGAASGVNVGGVAGGIPATMLDTMAFWGSFASGLDFVPHDMIAKVHRGERIVPANENSMGGSGQIVNINITTPDIGSFRASKGQLAAEMADAAAQARRRYR